jgi:hypothetical protein
MFRQKLLIALVVVLCSAFVTLGIMAVKKDFQKYEWVIETTRCNSEKIDTLTIISKGERINIDTYREAVPVLSVGINQKIVNICDFKVLSKTEK